MSDKKPARVTLIVEADGHRLTFAESGEVVADCLMQVTARSDEFVRRAFPADESDWSVDVDLPLGVTSADVMEKRAELASSLRRPS